MIERIARRAGGFASTTALRWLGAPGNSVAQVVGATASDSGAAGRLTKPLGKTVAAGALLLIASNEHVRAVAAAGLRKLATTVRPEAGGPRPSANGFSYTARVSNATPRQNGTSNGGNGSLSEKTRAELYEMAKQKDIAGRSSMTKQELARALSR